MVDASVVLLATIDTKPEEAKYLEEAISKFDVSVQLVDIALNTGGKFLSGSQKIERIKEVATLQSSVVSDLVGRGARVVAAIGGGTGSQIAIQILRSLPVDVAKVLITPLPFDPRGAVSDSRIILVPTLCDVQGLNPTLRDVLDQAGALIFGMVGEKPPSVPLAEDRSIAISGLGVTNTGVINLQRQLENRGYETTIFHAYGTGGAALIKWIDAGAFTGLIDFTPHELTRLRIDGFHVEMSRRFVAAVEAQLPMVVVPGGLNFIGMGEYEALSEDYRKRPIFRHSHAFTHVGVTTQEMIGQTEYFLECLSEAKSPVCIAVPMKGFSSTDCRGGDLYSPELREVFLKTARANASGNVQVLECSDLHIDDKEFAKTCADTFLELVG